MHVFVCVCVCVYKYYYYYKPSFQLPKSCCLIDSSDECRVGWQEQLLSQVFPCTSVVAVPLTKVILWQMDLNL